MAPNASCVLRMKTRSLAFTNNNRDRKVDRAATQGYAVNSERLFHWRALYAFLETNKSISENNTKGQRNKYYSMVLLGFAYCGDSYRKQHF